MPDEIPVLKERFRYMRKEMDELKKDVKENKKEIAQTTKVQERILFQLKTLSSDIESISTTISKDTGWRGFFMDFLKAVAQIGALVGAGKFIF